MVTIDPTTPKSTIIYAATHAYVLQCPDAGKSKKSKVDLNSLDSLPNYLESLKGMHHCPR